MERSERIVQSIPTCWLKREGIVTDECDYAPTYRADEMHVGLTEQWLCRAPNGPHLTEEQANDPRLIRDGCRKHHSNLDNANHELSLTREQIPPSVEEFAEEHDLVRKLNTEFGVRRRRIETFPGESPPTLKGQTTIEEAGL